MRLKEIKPGMSVHCKNDDEKKALLEEAERLGYVWFEIKRKPTEDVGALLDTIHFYAAGNGPFSAKYKHITQSGRTKGAIEFSDLIIPEMSAEEALLAYDQMCEENDLCNDCPIYKILGCECEGKMKGHISEIIDAINQWKSDHEKTEPEIETVDICRIIEILPDGRKRCVHEEDLASGSTDAEIKILVKAELKRYCTEHGGEYIAVHEVVSRVKAVE